MILRDDKIVTTIIKYINSKKEYIEHTNNKFKNHRRCICRYDRFIEAFYGSIYISLIDSVLNVL